MKKILLFLAVVGITALSGCSGPQGPSGHDGYSAESEVFELRHVNFGYSASSGYTIYQTLNPNIYSSDTILIYRMSDLINANTPVWQLIPRTLFLPQGELDYDFDFSKQDFTIYAGGTYDLGLTPAYIQDQTFRIVVIPGYFSNRGGKPIVDKNDYNAVIKAYHIDDANVKVLNK
jgi:hypothetical protein